MANHLFATAASMVPQAGMSGVATIIPMTVQAVLENNRIKFKTEDIVCILPGNDKIAHMVIQNAVNTAIVTKESVKNNPIVYISCDKGNKKGNKNLANYLCWYCVEDKKVKTYLLDVNCTDKSRKDIAREIYHS